MSKKSLLLFLFFLFIGFIIIGYFIILNSITYALIYTLFIVLSSYFFIEKRFILFNPFTLFVIYSYLSIFASLYLFNSKFEHSAFINSQSFNINIFELFNISLIYMIFSYISAYVGYKVVKKNFSPTINLHNDRISLKVVDFLIIVFALFAFINFSYNIFKFANGNFLTYMENISNRDLEFKTFGGTTFFYLFGYIAGYLWLYKLLKQNRKVLNSISFLLFVIITVCMKATTGRIFGTLSYVLSYFVIFYFVNYNIESNNNRKYFISIFTLVILGLLFYFFRLTSNLAYINQISSDFFTTIIELINFDNLMYFLIDKGNIPNIAVLMKIIDSWGNEIPFLYGESLITWVYGILPTSLRPEGYQPSVIIKQIWYLHIQGGNLPPMGMGEMFANFWYFGGIIGMYIFGVFVGFLYNLLKKFNNYWYLVIFSNISINFILIYSKGEFDNLSLWDIFPIGLTYLLLIVLTKFSIKNGSQSNLKNHVRNLNVYNK